MTLIYRIIGSITWLATLGYCYANAEYIPIEFSLPFWIIIFLITCFIFLIIWGMPEEAFSSQSRDQPTSVLPMRSHETQRPMNFCPACGYTWYPRGSDFRAVAQSAENKGDILILEVDIVIQAISRPDPRLQRTHREGN